MFDYNLICVSQCCSQALMSGWPQRVWGTEALVRVWCKAPRSQTYTNNLQLLNAFQHRFVAESVCGGYSVDRGNPSN